MNDYDLYAFSVLTLPLFSEQLEDFIGYNRSIGFNCTAFLQDICHFEGPGPNEFFVFRFFFLFSRFSFSP
jgi:hypothetical protein